MPKRKLTQAEFEERISAHTYKEGNFAKLIAGVLEEFYGLPEIDEPEPSSIGREVATHFTAGSNAAGATLTIYSATGSGFMNLRRVGEANPGEDLAHLFRIVASLVDEGIRRHVARQGAK